MKQDKIVVFDVGGVFFDFYPSIRKISEITGINYDLCLQMWRDLDNQICLGNMSTQVYIDQINQISSNKLVIDNFVQFWVNEFIPDPKIFTVATEVVNTQKIALLTNIFPGVFEECLIKHKIPDLPYSFIFKSCDQKLIKPDPKVFKKFCEEYSLDPQNLLLIDDTLHNLEAAHLLGWNTHHLQKSNPNYDTDLVTKIAQFLA